METLALSVSELVNIARPIYLGQQQKGDGSAPTTTPPTCLSVMVLILGPSKPPLHLLTYHSLTRPRAQACSS